MASSEAYIDVRVTTYKTCALGRDGRLDCWGDDLGGSVSGPNQSLDNYAGLSVGDSTTCAIRPDGALACWGHFFGAPDSGPNQSTASYGFGLCQDGAQCTTDTCDASLGCTHVPRVCEDDDNACTGNPTCDSAIGCTSPVVVCDDADSCTIDSCDPDVGCVFEPGPDSDGDGHPDVCDCAPKDSTNTPTLGVGWTLRVDKQGSRAVVSWYDDGNFVATFRVYRGWRQTGSPWSYGHACLEDGVTAPVAEDAEVPPAGRLFYYLVSRFGCGESDLGQDGSGQPIPNVDPCPSQFTDADGDGTDEALDVCPGLADPSQLDADDDAHGNACDNCPSSWNATQDDLDGDGIGDLCDPDADADGIEVDNCWLVPNVDQADGDRDSWGDLCDNCPASPNVDQSDWDYDLLGDACDLDDDNDGVLDSADACPTSSREPTVRIGECDSTVQNRMFSSGCTILDLVALCMSSPVPAERVACVDRFANDANVGRTMSMGDWAEIRRCVEDPIRP